MKKSAANNNNLRISIIGTVGVSACYSGFESLVDNLLNYTIGNVEYTVFLPNDFVNNIKKLSGGKKIVN